MWPYINTPKLPLLLTPLTYIHVGNPCPLPRGRGSLIVIGVCVGVSCSREWLCYPGCFPIDRCVRNWLYRGDRFAYPGDRRHLAACPLLARGVILVIQTLVIALRSPVSPEQNDVYCQHLIRFF